MKDFCYNPSDWTNQDQSHYCCLLLQWQIGNWALNCYIWLWKTVCERHNNANVWKTNLTWFMKDWFQTSVTFNFKIDGNIVGAQMWTVVERGRSLPSNATASRGHSTSHGVDYCGVAQSTGLELKYFSQKRALLTYACKFWAVWATLTPSPEGGGFHGVRRAVVAGMVMVGRGIITLRTISVRVSRANFLFQCI